MADISLKGNPNMLFIIIAICTVKVPRTKTVRTLTSF